MKGLFDVPDSDFPGNPLRECRPGGSPDIISEGNENAARDILGFANGVYHKPPLSGMGGIGYNSDEPDDGF